MTCDMNHMDNEDKGHLALGVCRIFMGILIFWGFWDKLLGLGFRTVPEMAMINGGSPTEYYLTHLVSGPLEGIYASLAGNPILDAMLMFALFACGLGLILGIASRLTTLGTCIFMAMMFSLQIPNMDNPILDYHIICLVLALTIYWLNGFSYLGLNKWWNDLKIVQRIRVRDIPVLG